MNTGNEDILFSIPLTGTEYDEDIKHFLGLARQRHEQNKYAAHVIGDSVCPYYHAATLIYEMALRIKENNNES